MEIEQNNQKVKFPPNEGSFFLNRTWLPLNESCSVAFQQKQEENNHSVLVQFFSLLGKEMWGLWLCFLVLFIFKIYFLFNREAL